MVNKLKRRGQKFIKKFSRASMKVSEEGKEHIKENLFKRLAHIKNVRLLVLEWALLMTALIMFAITQAFWSGNSYINDVFVRGGSYAEATLGRVNSMNPLFATTNSEKVLSRLMFATLTTIDYSGNPGLALASSLTASENGKVWTMKLRDSLKWSDGEPLTNEDVIFTIGLIQNPAVKSIYDSNLEGVRVTRSENDEIIFTLPAAYVDFATALEIPILPKHKLVEANPKTLVEDDFSNHPTTSGAFTFNAMQSGNTPEGEVFYLSANTYYYLRRPMLNSFAVHTYTDTEEIVGSLNAGLVTATAELSGPEADKVTSAAFTRKNSSINAGAFMFFNTSSERLKDVAWRTAIRQGLNLAEIREKAPDTIALNYPLLYSQIDLTSYPEIPGYNFEEAQNKIAELKNGEAASLNLVTVNSGYLPAVTEAIKSQLEALGLEVKMTVYEETQDFVANVVSARNYDILVYRIELGADPDPLPYYHSSQIGATRLNLSNYRSALADDAIISARETMNTELRAKKYETFLKYWVADVPAIGLYQSNMTYVYNKNARAYSNNVRLASAIDRFSDILNFATIKAARDKTP